MLSELVADLVDVLPDDAYPGEEPRAVVLEMLCGTVGTVLTHHDVADVERTTEFIGLAGERGIVPPLVRDDTFVGVDGARLEAATLRAAAAVTRRPYPTLVADGLLIRPGSDSGGRVCGRSNAARPIRRRSPCSTAHRRRHSPSSVAGRRKTWRGGRSSNIGRGCTRSPDRWPRCRPGQRLGMLLSAGRAAVFYESLSEDPELPLTLADGVVPDLRRCGARRRGRARALPRFRSER